MSKFRTSIFAKFLAWILIAISGMGFIGSGVAVIFMADAGFYGSPLSEIREEQYARYSDRYSAMALDYLINGNGGTEYFSNKNFKYGIVQSDTYEKFERLDLSKPEVYVETNFTEEDWAAVELGKLHVFQCAIGDNTYFDVNHPESLWVYCWIRNTGTNWHVHEIDRYVYEYGQGIFYCKADGVYYPIPNVLLHLYSDGNVSYCPVYLTYDAKAGGYQVETGMDVEHIDNSVLEITCAGADIEGYFDVFLKEDVFTFTMLDKYGVKKGEWIETYISDYSEKRFAYEYFGDEIVPGGVTDEYYEVATEVSEYYGEYRRTINLGYENFAAAGSEEEKIEDSKTVRIEPDGMIYVNPKEEVSTNYFVVSNVPESLRTYGEDWIYCDLYVKFEHVYGAAYANRYVAIAAMFGCLMIYILAFAVLCCMAGYRKRQTGLAESWTNKIPLEIYGAVTGFVQVMGICLLDALSYEIGNLEQIFWFSLAAVLVLLMGLLLTAMVLEIVTRIKLGILWKRTICYWILDKFFGGCKKLMHFVRTQFSIVVRITAVFFILCVAELFLIAMTNGYGGLGLILLFLEKIILYLAILSVASQLGKLKVAGNHVASGDLNYKVDTTKMFWDFKKHGENLNSIGDGLSLAVDERMKSEHFKTELITNVSHDIKTPLTSIINYVDLLQKEEIGNENAAEYLEVLARQSARLKKLLEDLLEASKASAGTLPVGFEVLEAGVFMVQTVGEFEEKTQAQQLELIIKKPEEPIYILADGRHFWRVIDNLMNNICKYAQPNTRVYINLEANDKEVYITFRNTSRYELNITSEELMERFVRGDSSRNTEGSGLGLSIAQSLMELMHGRFELVVDGDLFKVILIFDRQNAEEER